MSLAPYVRIVAQGKGRARTLTQLEATEAMGLILSNHAEPEALGALLMVLRLRGETDAEIAGFTQALRTATKPVPAADLDWPCYSAGRTRGAPLFLLSAKLVAQAGYKVVLHGWNSHQNAAAGVRNVLSSLDLEGGGLTYHPLEDLNAAAFRLLKLRDTFGLRSCINTVLRMWNPSGSAATVQGVFHPSYRGLQSRAAALLGDQNLTIIKGGGGEFERNPTKDTAIFGRRRGTELNENAPALLPIPRRLHEPDTKIDLAAVWSGVQQDTFAQETVVGTAALAFWTVGGTDTHDQALSWANEAWAHRHSHSRRAG